MTTCRASSPLFWLTLLLAVAGCSSSAVELAGKVEFNGQPIEQGTIFFEPSGPGVPVATVIKSGRYQVSPDQGMVPGKYIVRILAYRDATKPLPTRTASPGSSQPPDGADAPPSPNARVQFLPREFNAASQLTIDVRAGADHARNFLLTGSKLASRR